MLDTVDEVNTAPYKVIFFLVCYVSKLHMEKACCSTNADDQYHKSVLFPGEPATCRALHWMGQFLTYHIFCRRFLTRANGFVLSPTTNASNPNVVEETKTNEEETQTPHKLACLSEATKKSAPITTPKKCAPTRCSPRKAKPLTPCRRSPRKLVKGHLESAQALRQTSLADENQTDNPSKEISNLTLSCRIHLSENFPKDSLSSTPSKTVAAGQLNSEQLLGKNLSPTVTLCELPKCGYKRTRIQSCDSAGVTVTDPGEISDSPLSRLRSFKRKFRELNAVPGRTLKLPVFEKRSCLGGENGILPSSDGLLTLLQSSNDDTVNFEGF